MFSKAANSAKKEERERLWWLQLEAGLIESAPKEWELGCELHMKRRAGLGFTDTTFKTCIAIYVLCETTEEMIK